MLRDRSAFAIKPSDPDNLDVDDHAAALGLSMLYVPSMRNGPELREDRGNAIISTEPLLDPLALELPLARQRRVALGAAITVQTAQGPRLLQVVDAHLEPLSSPKTLWLFKNPRGKQVQAILDLLATPRFTAPAVAGIVLGGDFNTVRSGAGEPAYRLARAWSTGMRTRRLAQDAPDGPPRLPVLQAWRRVVGIDPPPRRTLRLGPLPGDRHVLALTRGRLSAHCRPPTPDPGKIPP